MAERVCVLCGDTFIPKSSRRSICYKDHYHPCPICGEPVKSDIHHQNNCCCKEHSRQKAVESIKSKYDEWPANGVEAVIKRKETNIRRYGVENPYQSEEIKAKIRNTILDRYGVDNVSKSELFIEKRKQTCRDKYGGNAPASSDIIKQKQQDTIKKRYGLDVKSTLCIPEVREKCKQTMMKKYGVENYMQNPILHFRHQVTKTFLGAYDVGEKECKLCGKIFKPMTIRQTYCNSEHTSKCCVCEKEFVVKNKYHIPKTCSVSCNRKLAQLSTKNKYNGGD